MWVDVFGCCFQEEDNLHFVFKLFTTYNKMYEDQTEVIFVDNLKSGWTEAKQGENILKNNWQNHENEKPFETLAKQEKVTLSSFFTPGPKKW
ncbi:hypothetical protein [Laceyella putida]|uniref:Integrase catalytic domain-containing protein n=1 Tax=Laceyella putida TaxID=110101 RepID=A0ABW2RM94_9BACL